MEKFIFLAHLMTPPVVLKHNHPMVPRTMDGVNAIAVGFKTAPHLFASFTNFRLNLIEMV